MTMSGFRGHATLSAWSKDLKRQLSKAGYTFKQPELMAMSTSGDPFLSGTVADVAWARWFADIWEREGFGRGAYLRRIHYRLVSKGDVPLPELYTAETGHKFYLNTVVHYSALNTASKHARYLGFIDPYDLIDNGSPESIRNTARGGGAVG